MPVTIKLTDVIDVDNPVVGDVHLTKGTYSLIGDTTGTSGTFSGAVAQTIRNRLNLFRQDWFLDTGEGVPWLQSILVKSPDLSAIRSLLRKVIQDTAGVAEVVNMTLDFDRPARKLSMTFLANLTDGTALDSAEFAPFIVEV